MGLSAFHAPNLLILDEPTNHLDIDSRRALIEALNDYSGAVILISHDRHLIEATVDRLWLVRDGTVQVFEGDLEEYRDMVVSAGKASPKREASASTAPAAEKPSAQKRSNPIALKKKIDDIQSLIDRIERLIQGIDTELSDPDLYAKNPGRAADLTTARANAQKKLDQSEEEWLALSTELEEIGG
jgi:ATP-binding cassette, subfamily F, member 3